MKEPTTTDMETIDTLLTETLTRHEGLRLRPYRCTAGKLTIGVGRNLDDVGITNEEARYLLNNDIEKVKRELSTALPYLGSLSINRQVVLLNMCFNLGLSRLKGFKKMFAAIEKGEYLKAATEMLDSKWARQVGQRSIELAKMMREG